MMFSFFVILIVLLILLLGIAYLVIRIAIRYPKKALIVVLLLSAFLAFKFTTADPKGYCSGKTFNGATGPYIADEEFLTIGMIASGFVYDGDGNRILNPSIEETAAYIQKYPGCCRVYRDLDEDHGPDTRNGLFRRAFGMKQFVIVAYREFAEITKNPIFSGGFEHYITVDTCGKTYSN